MVYKIKFQETYIILLIIGFLFSSLISSLLNLPFNINVLYRAFIAIIALLFITFSFHKRLLPKKFNIVLIFFLLYSFRILYDLFLRDFIILWPDSTALSYIQLYFGAILLPSISLMYVNYKKLDFDYIFRRIYIILAILLFVSFFLRQQSDIEGGRDLGGLDIGVLLYGQYGATFSILSLYRYFKYDGFWNKVISLLGYFVGFATIFVSASRSPFLALLLVSVFFLYKRFGKIQFAIVISLISGILYFSFFEILEFINFYFKSNFLDRLIYAAQGVDSGRSRLVGTAINEFIDKPFFGNAFLLQTGNTPGIYPHNLIIESFMALGIIGGSVFVTIIIKNIVSLLKLNYKSLDNSWVGLLFLQYLIFGMFSGSLYTSDLFWIFSIILIGVIATNRK